MSEVYLGNPNLKHETQESKEIGLELVLFDKKVSVDFAYFQDNNSDLLMSVPIAASTGYTSLYTNAASIKKQGVELSLNVIPIETCLLYTSPSPRDLSTSRMPSSA